MEFGKASGLQGGIFADRKRFYLVQFALLGNQLLRIFLQNQTTQAMLDGNSIRVRSFQNCGIGRSLAGRTVMSALNVRAGTEPFSHGRE